MGNLVVASGLEDVRQRVIERLLLWIEEWFLDVSRGVPYPAQIFRRPISAGLAAAVVTGEIRAVAGVTSVVDVVSSIDPDTRTFRYSARVVSEEGPFEVPVEVPLEPRVVAPPVPEVPLVPPVGTVGDRDLTWRGNVLTWRGRPAG